MKAKFQQSPASGHIVDDIIRLRQRLEYFERHIQTKSQEVKNEYIKLYLTLWKQKKPFVILQVFNNNSSK